MNTKIINFVDDFLIYSKNINDHLKDIELLLEILHENKFTIKFEKCKFLREEIDFLGHTVTTKGIKKQEKKINLVKTHPASKNKRELQKFLGVMNFNSKFTHKHAYVTEPLYRLLKNNAK